MDELNRLLLEIETLNRKVFETDIFIRYYLKILQDKFPKVWSRFIDAKSKYYSLKNIQDDQPLDNPLVNDDRVEPALLKFKKKKCKELYRKISNITHPDKIINQYLNELFIIAKQHMDKNDLRGLENIYDVVQNQINEPSYDFFSNKLIELENKRKSIERLYNAQILSFEYQSAKLYDDGTPESKRQAEILFISKLNELTILFNQELAKYEH